YWKKTTEDLMGATHTIITRVFHRNGQPIKSYRTAWDNARKRVGLQGKTFHDFRRTMTRHLRDAGVDDPTSMKITGHKTRSVFDRYNIRDERDVKNAADKLSRLA
ncbi:MAG: tyrosine-type recombinase/integrase, partial [Nitrospirota bacterium]|nr:tyrosine-type recombinase/integrase [Nitrospirota bacterium]